VSYVIENRKGIPMTSVQLQINYETLVELVEQLPESQQQDLVHHLLKKAPHIPLTTQEKMSLLRSAQLDVPINEEPPIRREDGYGDDGR
jgi:hypothetical protein